MRRPSRWRRSPCTSRASVARSRAPIRARREELARDKDYVWDVLHEGARRAREEAVATMSRVREAMHLVDPKGGGN